VDGYDHFDMVEKETRKRTFWSIYSWDKQSAGECYALVSWNPVRGEIFVVHNERFRHVAISEMNDRGTTEQRWANNSRMCAFVAAIRLHVVLEVCRVD
jgi:hypothetical protein